MKPLTDNQKNWLENLWTDVEKKLSVECDRLGDKIPYIPENGVYPDMGEHINWWTNGFWCGILWQLYHATGKDKYKETSKIVEKRLDQALSDFDKLDHDLGMMWMPSAVTDYLITGDSDGRKRGLYAASLLASRFNINGEFIRAWNAAGQEGYVIIDCLMNLPILYWASEELNDPRFRTVAEKHTATAAKYLLREDGSCNHIIVIDPNTGEYLDNPGGQGYESGSSWSRGQSWGIYGMALAYKYTQNIDYLNKAKQIAHYFIANVSLTDYVSVIDFRAPGEPLYYDTTATACTICGLLELSEHLPEFEKIFYQQAAIKMLEALDKRFINKNVDIAGVLTHGSGRYHRAIDREVPIIYGDYFLVEALLRLLKKNFIIW